MQQQNADPIAAIATAQGRGGVGVVRVSGKGIPAIAVAVLGKLPMPRHATYGDFLDENAKVIDQGIAVYFAAPNSYTGEDVLELQGHGGTAVLQMLLQRCLGLGARLAEPGEFTRRAFLNDKLDLAQAESVADLISATTTEAARSAMRSLHGDFSAAINVLVDELVRLRMLTEAMLDFPEEDIDVSDTSLRDKLLHNVRSKLQQTLATAKQGSLLREGAHVALVGRPNVGKSSLLNRLSGEEIALVSDVPGTTRDVIRQAIQIRGVPLHIMDTAGLRTSQDEVAAGITLFAPEQLVINADIKSLINGSPLTAQIQQAATQQSSLTTSRSLLANVQKFGDRAALFYPLLFEDRLFLVLLPAKSAPILRSIAMQPQEFTKLLVSFRADLQDASSSDVKESSAQLINI